MAANKLRAKFTMAGGEKKDGKQAKGLALDDFKFLGEKRKWRPRGDGVERRIFQF